MANPDAIARAEFEQMASRLAALEASAPRSHALIDEEVPALSNQSEVVTQNEFRLFKWLVTFVVAAVLGAFGVLYQQIADTRVEMRDLHNTTLREIYRQIGTQIGGFRQEVGEQISGLRQEVGEQIGGLRQEVGEQIGGLRQEVGGLRQDVGDLRQEMGTVRERVVRIETLLAGEESRTKS